ncbi:hypothetical protein D9619_013407 [Psilocybe cf. subviscida]|uniref:Uncharacterized protein n=1 Tax=Psilocybe cf. subviscida TaxID=2480587 RepID=A0A8H5F998_9AGAR|nr:hypothetical protein D9619_013407 [Psilocybe cf. subviscida]
MLVSIIIYLLVQSQGRLSKARKATFSLTIIMYILSTTTLFIMLSQSLLEEDSRVWVVIGTTIGVTNVIFAEVIIFWRVWVVWSRQRWITILPALSLLVSTGLGYYSASRSASFDFGDAFQVVSLLSVAANNVVSTLLIAGRIWYLQRRINQVLTQAPGGDQQISSKAPMRIATIIIESGALYSCFYISGIILFKWSSVAVIVILGLLTQMAGILPTMIMLLVHLDMTPGARVAQEYDDMIQLTTHARSEETAVEWEERRGDGEDVIYIGRHDTVEVNVSLADGNNDEK